MADLHGAQPLELTRLFKSPVPDQVTGLVSGVSKLVVLEPGQTVVAGVGGCTQEAESGNSRRETG